jgi:hypothetical protein
MRRLFASVPNFACVQPRALLRASSIALATLLGQFQAAALPAGILHTAICDSEDPLGYMPGRLTGGDMLCPAQPRVSTEIAEARAYLVETASPGFTMSKQGPELAIERLHPEFAIRLANAIREARDSGLPSVGVFSAYRPPAFGIGGFSDKFNSLHSYGLAADMAGIGGPGSVQAQRWHQIAARNGVICPYGPFNAAEWNHCQPTGLKIIVAENPLRHTITAAGPVSLEGMFEVGTAIIAQTAGAQDIVGPIGKEPALRKAPAHRVAQNDREDREDREERRASKAARRLSKAGMHGGGQTRHNVRLAGRRETSKDDDD